MIQILNDKYTNIEPMAPTYKAVAVFNKHDAELAFKYAYVDFVIALNEETGGFSKCFSVYDCEKFYE
jgi:ABC-type transport system substrate-binding protein